MTLFNQWWQPVSLTHYPKMAYGGWATRVLLHGRQYILTDPVFSRRASPLPFLGHSAKRLPLCLSKTPQLDAVVISHNHYDHLDDATIRHPVALSRSDVFVPLGLATGFVVGEQNALNSTGGRASPGRG
jgi:L-ascorbate metabolism protein UlaG (beta-lactamase superfamily)